MVERGKTSKKMAKKNREVAKVRDGAVSTSTHTVKTNKADLGRDMGRVAREIRPKATGASVIIKCGESLTLDDAKLAVGEVSKHLPPEAEVLWSCDCDKYMPKDGVEIRLFVAYRKKELCG